MILLLSICLPSHTFPKRKFRERKKGNGPHQIGIHPDRVIPEGLPPSGGLRGPSGVALMDFLEVGAQEACLFSEPKVSEFDNALTLQKKIVRRL